MATAFIEGTDALSPADFTAWIGSTESSQATRTSIAQRRYSAV